jgi:hypothetical protein
MWIDDFWYAVEKIQKLDLQYRSYKCASCETICFYVQWETNDNKMFWFLHLFFFLSFIWHFSFTKWSSNFYTSDLWCNLTAIRTFTRTTRIFRFIDEIFCPQLYSQFVNKKFTGMIIDGNNSSEKISSIIYSISVMKSVSNNFTYGFIDGQNAPKKPLPDSFYRYFHR